MNAYVKKLVLYSTAMVAVAFLSATATPAYAQRAAGAKAWGDSNSFWHPKYQSKSFFRNRAETRRSYSYEPTAAVAGCQCGSSQAAPAESTAAQPQVVRRSFSYEPSHQSSRSYSAPKKAPWQYPKTDPRRYQP
jgi:hypothetical protein